MMKLYEVATVLFVFLTQLACLAHWKFVDC